MIIFKLFIFASIVSLSRSYKILLKNIRAS